MFTQDIAGGTSDVDNRLYIARSNSAAGNAATWIHGDESGNVFQGNNSSTWSTTSDIRLKKNITDSSKGLAEINRLRVTNFEYKTREEIDMSEFSSAKDAGEVVLGEGNEGKIQTGVIAQEVESVLPECIQIHDHGVKTVSSSENPIFLRPFSIFANPLVSSNHSGCFGKPGLFFDPSP